MIHNIEIDVQDINHEEKGFFRATIKALLPNNMRITLSACGRGAARSIGFALKKFGSEILDIYPEYPEQKELPK